MNVPGLIRLLETHAGWSQPPASWEEIRRQLGELLAGAVTEGVSQAKAAALAARYGVDASEVLATAEFDPTPNGAYTEWLLKQVRAGGLRLPEDGEVKEQLAQFHALKAKSTYTGQKDVNKLDASGLWELLQAHGDTVGKKERARAAAADGVRQLADAGGHQVWEVTTPEAGAKLFRGTNWCVKDPEYFNRYGPPFYMVTEGEDRVALYHVERQQFMNKADKPVHLAAAARFIPALAEAGLLCRTQAEAHEAMLDESLMPLVVSLSLLQFMDPARLAAKLDRSVQRWEKWEDGIYALTGPGGKGHVVKVYQNHGGAGWNGTKLEEISGHGDLYDGFQIYLNAPTLARAKAYMEKWWRAIGEAAAAAAARPGWEAYPESMGPKALLTHGKKRGVGAIFYGPTEEMAGWWYRLWREGDQTDDEVSEQKYPTPEAAMEACEAAVAAAPDRDVEPPLPDGYRWAGDHDGATLVHGELHVARVMQREGKWVAVRIHRGHHVQVGGAYETRTQAMHAAVEAAVAYQSGNAG